MQNVIDQARPRWYCRTCGSVEYCHPWHKPPESAKRRLEKRHVGCSGSIEYRAGFIVGQPITGQEDA